VAKVITVWKPAKWGIDQDSADTEAPGPQQE
jgi:hypothetical protein